ncbi:efflux RND transporter periplasmic adaptor subunit [Enterovirga sp. CN4-39]|uniref:efflux RND transporter periplasmic adaptor subunit n=1 Tax=Enterovirga sp. CN4-39 TaxID=3400910 RepID=UPI003C0DF811
MRRAAWLAGTLAAIAAGVTGYVVGRDGAPLAAMVDMAQEALQAARRPGSNTKAAAPPPSGPVIYYRDPDGKPAYSAGPRKTADGRDYLAVRASEDVSFEDKPAAETPSGAGHASEASADTKRVLYYRNPMGLPDTSPVPKKDSMGMDYIPVLEGEAEDGNVIRLSPGKIQRTGVRTTEALERVLSAPVRAPGTVEEDERRISVVATRTDAFVEAVENVTTGDHVHKGQPLFRLYSPEIASAAAQYLTAIGYDGARRRLENLAIPGEVIDEIERTRKVPAVITWSAPRDGVVVERNVSTGMRARAGDVLFRIVDHSRVWVVADVSERDLGRVAEGQAATVRVRSFPGRSFVGTVTRIYPHLAAGTRTARLRIELANPEGALRPAMYAEVRIETGAQSPVTSVPEDAILDTGTKQVVLLDRGEGRFEPREVKLGQRGEGYVEVREGLAVGDTVVTSANFLIDAESNLKAALQALTVPPSAPTTQAMAGEKAP